MVQVSHAYMTTGKTMALTRWTFVGKEKSLFFNMLSRSVIAFLPRSNRALISWLQSPSTVILEPHQNKVWHCFHCFPIYLPWSDGTRCHNLRFLNVELEANFFTFLTFIKEKAMATHSSTLAWKIPYREEPDRLQSMGSLRVRHDWATWQQQQHMLECAQK